MNAETLSNSIFGRLIGFWEEARLLIFLTTLRNCKKYQTFYNMAPIMYRIRNIQINFNLGKLLLPELQ